jgi:hypothetical protein
MKTLILRDKLHERANGESKDEHAAAGHNLSQAGRCHHIEYLRLRQDKAFPLEPLAKLPLDNHCHFVPNEESRIFIGLRAFTPFRMTEKRLLQEALWLKIKNTY